MPIFGSTQDRNLISQIQVAQSYVRRVNQRRTANVPTYTAPRPTTTTTRRSSSPPSGPSAAERAAQAARDAEARAKAEQAKRDAAAAKKYESAAKRIEEQVADLRRALGSEGYRKRLEQDLKNYEIQFNEADSLLLEQYARGREELEQQAETTEAGKSTGTVQALSNAGRERSEAIAQIAQHGSGVTDMLRAMTSSLRNWEFNQAQVQENYMDTLNSLNSSNAEMVNATSAQRQSAWRNLEEQRATRYSSYYDSLSQTYTDIGNKLGEAANLYSQAIELQSTDARTSAESARQREAREAHQKAAEMTGKNYTERATPDRIQNWEGEGDFENTNNARRFVQPELRLREAEGATLRRWQG
jgi:negative regulator of replication initiation